METHSRATSSHGSMHISPGPGFHASPSPPASLQSQRRSWRSPSKLFSRRSSATAGRAQPEGASHDRTRASVSSAGRNQTPREESTSDAKWWRIRFFRGMIDDVKRRAPYYWSDWADAWDYRVVPATIYMYFANILPALAFSLDMFEKTRQSYGVNEVLLASVLGAVVFSLFAAQPLVIVGVTGPITVFNYTVYDIISPRGTPYLAFMCWIGM
ncbi:Putative Anion transporter (Eurofung) [Aspergillus calidoustus]|uniref:Putative Anion transporter (Eurofung) n=1 Tax=Aspergillus calidoustus TaxID=454130 RepID=A0A0U5G8K0_ASPCI|nr:Putative Anion transporter (Eurofung) [Aspergillus calidoustus]